MEEYKIKIFPSAKRDLLDIVDYLNTLSPQAALQLYDHIVGTIESLKTMPERCPIPKIPQLRSKGYRMLIVDNYLVFFVIKNDTIQIRRIIFGMREYELLL